MGVHGLWQLLHQAGQPVSLESLEGKVLAVDVSIWLHQTMKGMRDRDGNPLPNAHLQGLFSRICKLLFYRIKPVFVFDGGVPALKKQTMAARRERRAEAERESQEISQKLLHNLIKSQAVRQTIGDVGGSQRQVPGVHKGRNQPDRDMFQLAPLPESEEIGLALNSEEWDKDFELQESWIKEGLAAVSDTHPDSEEFRSLPAEIQHEVLSELKQQKKYHSLSRINKMPEDSTDFSSYQLKKLMKQSKLTARIDEVRKQMTSNTADDITCNLGDEYRGDEVEARRIVSEDAAHYVLIKGLTKKRQQEEADRYEIQSRVKLEKVDEDDNDYGVEKSASDHSLMKDIPQSGHIDAKVQSSAIISSDSDSDLEAVISSRLRRKRRPKPGPSWSGMKTGNPGAASVPHHRADQIVGECEVIYSSSKQNVNDVSCTSEDEGFIEVTVDPSAAAVDDDLFPASIFQTDMDSMFRDTTGAVGGLHLKKVTPSSSDLIQTKNTSTKLNSSEKLSAGTAKEALCEELGDTAFSSKHSGERKELLPQMSEIDDITARRKNILTEILYQLEQKKKCVGDALLDDCGDTAVPISDHEAMQVNHESVVGDSLVVTRSESKDLIPQYSVAGCSKELSPQVAFSEVQETSGGFLTNTLDEASSFSESDEELKIAIELSLQSNRSDRNKCHQTTDCSLSGFLEDSASTSMLKDHSIEETTSGLLKPQEVNKKSHTEVTCDSDNDTEDFVEVESEQLLLENHSMTTEDETLADSETDIQEDTDADRNQDSDGSSRSVTAGGERHHNQPHSSAVIEEQPVESSSGLLQPEDYEIDHDGMFQEMNQGNLEDARTRLESERSALLSERGRHTRMATSITEQTNLEAQELLQMFGIPFIVSPMEAEAQCAYLDITNQTAGTITDDSDIWLFGGRRMYKNFFNQSKHVEFFTYDGIYSHFGISRAQLINVALLCGSDYTEGIPGVGPVRALEIMAEFPGDGLEGLQSFRKWWSRAKSQTFPSENKVRAGLKDLKVIPGFPSEAVVDAYLHPEVDESLEKFTWGMPDLDMLREFTKYKFGWSKEKTDQSLLPMMKQLSMKQSQGRIQMYFQPHHFAKTLKIQSERMKRALASMKKPRQTVEEEDQLHDNIDDSNHTENTTQGHKGTQKRKATDNGENIVGDRSKLAVVTNKPVKHIAKKNVKTVKERELKLVGKKVHITDEVMIDDSEQLEPENTGKERIKVGKTIMNRQKQVKEIKRVTLTKSRKNKAIVPDEQGLSIEGNREEKMVAAKQNPSHKQAGIRSDGVRSDGMPRTGTSIGKGKSRRGRRMMGDKYIGGRGKLPVSLDEMHATRGKHLRKGKTNTARGIVNLSESSSSSSDSSNESELSDNSKSDIIHAKHIHHSKNMLSSTVGRNIPEQGAQLKATQKNTVVAPQVSGRETAGVTSQHSVMGTTGSQPHRLSSSRKKIYQKCLNDGLTTDMSVELTQLKQKRTSGRMDGIAGSDETDSDNRKADVSVINRQNLPSTLTYLNRRSREDQFLLHQLKGHRTVDAVEKRLEAGQRKSMLDKQTHVNTGQVAEQNVSFADILGGLDVVATKSVSSTGKGKKMFMDKKQSTINDSPTKTLQNKILQQIGQFGSVLAGASSTDNSDTVSIKQPKNQSHISNKERHSQDIIHLISNDKQPLAVNKNQTTNKTHMMGETESHEKAVGSCSNASLVSNDIRESCVQSSVEKDKTLKSNRSKAFDKPISECSSDYSDSDRDARKPSKKKRFLKQMEHLGDSKSVKGLGSLPRQTAESTLRIKAGRGSGIRKSHTNPAGISDKQQSENALGDELQEYALITADDLGSDFSDCDV